MQNAALNLAFELKALQYKISEAKSERECAAIMASYFDKKGFEVKRKEPEESPFEKTSNVRDSSDFVALSTHTHMAKTGASLDMRQLMDSAFVNSYVPSFIDNLAKESAYKIVKGGYYHVDTHYDALTDLMHFETSVPYFMQPVGWTHGLAGSYMGKKPEWRQLQKDQTTGMITVSKHLNPSSHYTFPRINTMVLIGA